MDEVKTEVNALIQDSPWQHHVDVDRVCNLTSDQVSATELELLSLGMDFKLGCARSSIIDAIVGFETYDTKHRYTPGFHDLQR